MNPPTRYNLDGPYLGLQNIGATCYMNSVLQTLFMTPQFRRGLYLLDYNKQVHGQEQDCIPFQLQRLFARLQTKIFPFIDTRDLTKSFQWDVQQAFEQHDIQEFIRLLFDAIEKYNLTFVKDLYVGEQVNYTKCLTCGYESRRQQQFMDYSVIVKDKYGQIYNDSLEKAIQRSLKPERLAGDNKYFCDCCQSKQDADRGQNIGQLGEILSVHLTRFAFDYQMMRREKIDDLMTFPFVLNMNDYMHGYDGIKNKLNEETDPSYFKTVVRPQVTKPAPAKLPFPPIPKKTGKPSEQTKSFIEQMRQQQRQNKTQKNDIDVIIVEDNHKPIQQVQVKQEDKVNIQVDDQKQKVEQKEHRIEEAIEVTPIKQDQLTITTNKQTNEQNNDPADKPIVNTMEERRKYEAYLNEKYIHLNSQNQVQIQRYLEDGPEVYELYSILNHSGGALGGHYFAYIKSFEDGKWYCFNDSNVTMTDPDEMIQKTQGQGNSSAYMLFYQRIQKQEPVYEFLYEELPDQVKLKLAEEKVKLEEHLKNGGDIQDMQGNRPIKVIVYFKLENKQFLLESTETLETLKIKAMEHFKIQNQNCRLRIYQAYNDKLLDDFTNREKRSLGALKLHNKTLAFEFKQTDEPWTIYDENNYSMRFTIYRQNLEGIDEKSLVLHKIIIKREASVRELKESISEEHNLGDIMLVRRIGEYGDIVALDKPVSDFTENSIFYVEPTNSESLWTKEFEEDAHRIYIKFNQLNSKTISAEGEPNDEYPLQCSIDDRSTMLQLKIAMCAMINVNPNTIIMRRGGRAGLELKDLEIEVGLNHFVKGSSIYLEVGTPIKPGEYRCIISLAKPNLTHDRNFYHFTELGEMALQGEVPVSNLIPQIQQWTQDKGHLIENIRLRERINDRLNKVYRDKPLKEQGIIELRQISIEQGPIPQPKEILIYVRFWDQQLWDLSPRFEFIVSRSQSALELAYQLYNIFPIEPANLEVCRIVSIQRFNRFELLSEQWISLDSDQIMLASQPLHITTDGTLLILRDGKQEPRELSAEEKKQYGIINSKPAKNPVYKYQHQEEKAMKITVKLD